MKKLRAHALIVFVISAGFSFSQESRYQIIGGEDENFSWQEADAKAKTLSGHLATITSDEEMGIIARLLNDFERTTGIRPIPWIGGFEAGNPLEWRWVTGEPFTYTNWYIGLTTINPPGDDEIYLQTGSSGWQFYPQNRGRGRSDYFILEKPPVDTDGDVSEPIVVQNYTYAEEPFWQFPDTNNLELTDGIIPTNTFGGDITAAQYEPMVGFSNQDAQITFKFNGREKVDTIKIYADDADGLRGNQVYFPEFVEVSTPDGYLQRIQIDDPDGAPSFREIKLSVEVTTDELTLRIGHSREYVILGEVQFLKSNTPEFQVIEGPFTWQEARADAEAKGGRLAVLNTQAKIDAANAYLEGVGENPNLWIGLSDSDSEGDWRWVNGDFLSEENWASGEPNNAPQAGGNEDFACMIGNRQWNDLPNNGWIYQPLGYLLEILDQTPAVPFVAIDPLYESPTGESITLDATPTVGFPTEFTYQWCFNGFKIPANLGGTASSINIDNLQANEGTWSVSITNSEGIFEQDFEYRLYADSDSDGLSDGYEEVISQTDLNNPDTDNDGLGDADEVNTYRTNPNSPDSDSDGFTDLYELETAYDPNSAESVPDALVEIMTAIEVKFNAALGATYTIEFSTDNQTWDVIEDDIVGEGGAIERLYSKQEYPTG
ncbi:hypothetical protein N8577_04165, partial [Akkermansiaceae bacterium]|nr:hypothetical protein [Akkermansiaceae bacterium]